MKQGNSDTKGTIFAILAFTFWGLVPIYFKQVSHVGAFEVLIHRVLWSIVFLAILLVISNSMSNFLKIIKDKNKLKILFLSALLVSFNWLVFIWGISHNMIVEVSLGYFINPLINLLLGYLFFGERVNKQQLTAIALVFIAIMYQIYSLGELPLISLLLAFSFGLYGLVRKKIRVEPISGLFIETILISPFAVLYLVYLAKTGQSLFIVPLDQTSWLLILAGLITIVPLIWFNMALSRITMTKIGIIQYIGPSISFLLAIFLYGETLNFDKLVSLIMIWIALIIFSVRIKIFHKK